MTESLLAAVGCFASAAALCRANIEDCLSCRRLAPLLSVAALLSVATSCPSAAQDAQTPAPPFTICHNQTYALCATAQCFVFNKVSYCKCDVESGDSISLTDKFDRSDVCSVNAAGPKGGYMVSTYSLPQSIVAPAGNQALYTCRGSTSTGAYAQCDGGMCFTSSSGGMFPGFSGQLGENQIICACPITVADPGPAKRGYQIIGPYPCEVSYLRYCDAAVANTKNGSTIVSGASTGGIRLFTRLLYGSVPRLNECRAGPE
jgi:hypothetical protein